MRENTAKKTIKRKTILIMAALHFIYAIVYVFLYFRYGVNFYYVHYNPNLALTLLFAAPPWFISFFGVEMIRKEFWQMTPYYFTKKDVVAACLKAAPFVAIFMALIIIGDTN